jgi:hypothetical protein
LEIGVSISGYVAKEKSRREQKRRVKRNIHAFSRTGLLNVLFFHVGAGVKIQGFALAGHGTMPPPILLWLFFEIGFHFFPKLAWTMILLFMPPCRIWGDRYVTPCPAFSVEMRSPEFFLSASHCDPSNLSLPSS